MPVSSIGLQYVCLGGGDQSSVMITTAGVDAELTACAMDLALLGGMHVRKAWVEVRARSTNTFAGPNSIVSGTLGVSSDNGGTFPTTAISFSNAFGYSLVSPNTPSYGCLVGQQDVSADVLAAVTGGFNLKFKLLTATAAQNTLVLYDINIVLHAMVG